jgi:hypothetical protein
MFSQGRKVFSHSIPVTFAVLALAGCAAVGPDYVQPEAPVPDSWEVVQDSGLKATQYEVV